MNKSLIPKSKAKTAYGLLSEIRKLITDEPKRYDQQLILQRDQEGEHAPACGTIGCVAGWVVQLKSPRTHKRKMIEKAAFILGLDFDPWRWTNADTLFADDAAGQREEENPTEHAERGAAHIAAFQSKHRSKLKAKRV